MSRSCQIAKVVTAWKKGKVAEGIQYGGCVPGCQGSNRPVTVIIASYDGELSDQKKSGSITCRLGQHLYYIAMAAGFQPVFLFHKFVVFRLFL